MTLAETDWEAVKTVVAEALDLPTESRHAHIQARCSEPAQRAEATRLLRACELAAESPIFEVSAGQLGAPVMAAVEENERVLPEALRTALAGRYTIERELGRGGMATVYLARDERHGRAVALKLLRPELGSDAGPERGAARFQREVKIAARLSHPHILPLFDSGAASGLLYYITPYVDGETLRERLKREGPPPIAESLRILRDIARALAYAHRQGLIHRDIKPANILLNKDGDALVADFGVAKGLAAAKGAEEGHTDLTEAAFVLGTPAYMAPEQVTGASSIDHRADLYALGALAYELLTGAAPFAGRPRDEQLAAHIAEVPAPVASRQPGVPPALAALVDRLLAKRPDERPRDAEEVVRIIDSALAVTRRPALARFRPRFSPRTAVIAAAALTVVAGGGELARRRMSAQTAPVRVAVLPFVHAGDSAGTHHLAVGLSDEISTDLARLAGAAAPGYVTTSIYRHNRKSVQQIAAEQQVRAVLRGSVQRVGDRVRVDARLVEGESGNQLWQRSYDRPASQLLEIKGDIIRGIASTLDVRLTGRDRDLLNRNRATDPRAYDFYLRGRAAELDGQSREPLRVMRVENIRMALSLYSQARDLDLRFAAARARLALMHGRSAATYDRTKARREQVRIEAEAALRLNPGLPEAHAALATYFQLSGDMNGAIEKLRLAVAGFPHDAELHVTLGSMLERVGRIEDAVVEYEHARRLEPGNAGVAFTTGLGYSRMRRRDEAMRAFSHAIALAPAYHMPKVIKGHVYLRWTGNPDTLAEAMRGIPPDWDPDGMATYARFTALSVQRKYSEALAMLDRSRSELSRDRFTYWPTPLMRARLQEALGQRESALASYAKARTVVQDSLAARPADPHIRAALAKALAGLGRTDEAVREVRRALELAPVSTDVTDAAAVMSGAAEALGSARRHDEALEILELLFSMRAEREVTVPFLRVWPGFDPLRSHPRFQELLVRFDPQRSR
ncbi:MAG: protein kinase [Gemmatimonadaceae bacterium]|nr:protein kinase [Gemmatimonadaceae bacterium]